MFLMVNIIAPRKTQSLSRTASPLYKALQLRPNAVSLRETGWKGDIPGQRDQFNEIGAGLHHVFPNMRTAEWSVEGPTADQELVDQGMD